MQSSSLNSENDPKDSTLRSYLKNKTSGLHEVLDESLSRIDFGSKSSYGRFLLGHFLSVSPLETWLESNGVSRLLSDWSERARSKDLINDLNSISVSIPATSRLSMEATDSILLGVLYTLEGSRLGGQMISKMVLKSNEPAIRSAISYFSSPTDLWKTFVCRLESYEVDREQVVHGAVAAFEHFQSSFNYALNSSELE